MSKEKDPPFSAMSQVGEYYSDNKDRTGPKYTGPKEREEDDS